ncbi:MAG TPA: hypothetical protein PKY46_09230 [Ignavibacteriaceae bacterium]|nr:hypothetical protein [Ignavibacteriaceae bacterium]
MKPSVTENHVNNIVNDKTVFWEYYKARYPAFNNSNIFKRDLQYAVKRYLEFKGIKAALSESDQIAEQVLSRFIKEGILKPLDNNTFRLSLESN